MKLNVVYRYMMCLVSLSAVLATESVLGQQTAHSELTDNLPLASFDCARFKQERYLADFETSIHSSGFLRKDGDSIEWHTLEPIEDTIIIGPDADKPPPALSAMEPLLRGLLTGNWQQLEDYFSIELSETEGAWQAILLPRQEPLAEHLNTLLLSGAEAVDKIELYFTNQDQLTIQLQSMDCATFGPKR